MFVFDELVEKDVRKGSQKPSMFYWNGLMDKSENNYCCIWCYLIEKFDALSL